MKKLVTLMCSLLMAHSAFGAGFALYEYSGRSTAMGGAVMASDAEPASLATNPSLITELDSVQAQLSATLVRPKATTTINNSTSSFEDSTFFLPSAYATAKLSDQISFGIGAFSRYGLGGKYKNYQTWTGSNLAYEVNLETVSITPTIFLGRRKAGFGFGQLRQDLGLVNHSHQIAFFDFAVIIHVDV